MSNTSLAIWKASSLAKRSSENKAVGDALVGTADRAAVVVGDEQAYQLSHLSNWIGGNFCHCNPSLIHNPLSQVICIHFQNLNRQQGPLSPYRWKHFSAVVYKIPCKQNYQAFNYSNHLAFHKALRPV